VHDKTEDTRILLLDHGETPLTSVFLHSYNNLRYRSSPPRYCNRFS